MIKMEKVYETDMMKIIIKYPKGMIILVIKGSIWYH